MKQVFLLLSVVLAASLVQAELRYKRQADYDDEFTGIPSDADYPSSSGGETALSSDGSEDGVDSGPGAVEGSPGVAEGSPGASEGSPGADGSSTGGSDIEDLPPSSGGGDVSDELPPAGGGVIPIMAPARPSNPVANPGKPARNGASSRVNKRNRKPRRNQRQNRQRNNRRRNTTRARRGRPVNRVGRNTRRRVVSG